MLSISRALPLLFLAPVYTSAFTFTCDGEKDNGHTFVAKTLGGPKQIHYQEDLGASVRNTTFTIDLCQPLKVDPDQKKEEQCHRGARICGQAYIHHGGSPGVLEAVKDIAGQYTDYGRDMDSKIEWMGKQDVEQEGYRVTMQGGRVPFDDKKGRPQQAIIEFICDKDLTGLEGFDEQGSALKRRDDEEDERPKLPDLDAGKSLKVEKYHQGEDMDTLRLSWRTKYACADAPAAPDPPASNSSHWGFFTWFVVIVFLLVAAYIIFGSWLNYNRYGARGWDLIPHGDTIRDLPYIIKESASNLMSRIRGDGSRGGYSAV